ncbi:hypothetical protein pb186bvf_008346 [Paramecium bursaria]
MGTSQAKKHLQKAIETENVEYAREVLTKFPQLLDEPLYTKSNITPLARATWRGDKDMVMFLCEVGCSVDKPDNDSQTPLMWAAKRDHADICCLLIRFNANLIKRSREGFTALDYAILQGSYASAYILYEFDKQIQEPFSYETIRQMKQWRYIDYELMLKSLIERVMPQKLQDIYTKPQGKVYNDPVIDPRESWSQMFKRVMKFEPPPICERQELPQELQPQNRLLGRLNSYINGLNPIPLDNQSIELDAVHTND